MVKLAPSDVLLQLRGRKKYKEVLNQDSITGNFYE